ncbi:MAG: hypothetical protein FJ241_06670 [Nitrospira sp.]|nr:hypothetical protein [Nitrospira sp.]
MLEEILFKNRKIFFYFVDYCNNKYRSGHDLSLYRDIIDLHRRNNNLDMLLNQNSFYNLIMETLSAWNMDQQGAELTSVDDFKASVQTVKPALYEMYKYKLYDIDRRAIIEQIATPLKSIFCNLKVMKTKTRIVGVSKAMHFLLPDLIMPIDRRYILNFFYGNTNIDSKTCDKEFKTFKEIFQKTFQVKRNLCLKKEDANGEGWKTSVPKLIDNAIIGFLRYLYSHEVDTLKSKLTEIEKAEER